MTDHEGLIGERSGENDRKSIAFFLAIKESMIQEIGFPDEARLTVLIDSLPGRLLDLGTINNVLSDRLAKEPSKVRRFVRDVSRKGLSSEDLGMVYDSLSAKLHPKRSIQRGAQYP